MPFDKGYGSCIMRKQTYELTLEPLLQYAPLCAHVPAGKSHMDQRELNANVAETGIP